MQAAQHALGLAGIGSVIEPRVGTVRVRVGDETQLRLTGEQTLWWVANAPPPLLQLVLERLMAEVERQRRGMTMQVAATTFDGQPLGMVELVRSADGRTYVND